MPHCDIENLTCSVLVDGLPLPEFGLEESINDKGQRQYKCWVPSEAGKEFTVNVQGNKNERYKTRLALVVDGQSVRAHNVPEQKPVRNPTAFSHSIEGRRVTQTSILPMVFSLAQTTDDDTYLNASNPHLGSITLSVSLSISQVMPSNTRPSFVEHSLGGPVHERDKKGGKHSVSFGARRVAAKSRLSKTIGYARQDFVTFTFAYRSIDELQANGIAPAVEPTDTKPLILDLTVGSDDEKTEEARLRRISKLQVQLKREREGLDVIRGRKRVKREPSTTTVPSTSREVIDLT
ncbi:hypothetical protein DL96DRAFT_1619332 [Flagelloscypha sp. PMI_526]|nr:hypothetical protein DL96DRAFT_1619332 [Flagelloscypha sp. PMI_526]